MLNNNHNCCSTHCCIRHGCKYGHEDCPVVLGKIEQVYICEMCDDDIIHGLDDDNYKQYTREEYRNYLKKEFIKENRKFKLKNINSKNNFEN